MRERGWFGGSPGGGQTGGERSRSCLVRIADLSPPLNLSKLCPRAILRSRWVGIFRIVVVVLKALR